MKTVKILFLTFVFACLFSCDSKTYTQISPEIASNKIYSYTNDVKQIIANNCISCHAPGTSVNKQPYLTTFIEVKNACTTDLGSGTLLCRIEPNCPKGNDPMPQTGFMSKSLVDVVKKWSSTGYNN